MFLFWLVLLFTFVQDMCLKLSLQLHTRLHKLEQERRQQSAQKLEVYTQQVALEQLKDENKDKARLAQKLAELEVLLICA